MDVYVEQDVDVASIIHQAPALAWRRQPTERPTYVQCNVSEQNAYLQTNGNLKSDDHQYIFL